MVVGGGEIGPEKELLLLHRGAEAQPEDLVLVDLADGAVVDVGHRDLADRDRVVGDGLAALQPAHGDEQLHLLTTGGLELEATLVEQEEKDAENADDERDEESATIHPRGMLPRFTRDPAYFSARLLLAFTAPDGSCAGATPLARPLTPARPSTVMVPSFGSSDVGTVARVRTTLFFS